MRRAHRKAHTALWAAIVPALAVILWLAFSARQPEPANAALPDVLGAESGP